MGNILFVRIRIAIIDSIVEGVGLLSRLYVLGIAISALQSMIPLFETRLINRVLMCSSLAASIHYLRTPAGASSSSRCCSSRDLWPKNILSIARS